MEEEKEREECSERALRRRAVEALLERGVVFEAERRGWWRRLRPKVRLRVDPPTLGVLYAVSGEFAQMEIDEHRVEADPLGYSFELVRMGVKTNCTSGKSKKRGHNSTERRF